MMSSESSEGVPAQMLQGGVPAQDERHALHQTDHVFAGHLQDLPEKESSIVRIFLSSTFTDMQSERNWLMKNAMPHLRRFCQERGLDFQIADMRWGVRDDALDDHRTMELCLREIKNCQKVSRGPNFVAFLGDKYGYRPLPSKIESSQFKLLKNAAIKLGYDTTLLLTWYLCDNNEEPAMYVLQPVSSKFPHFLDMLASNSHLRQQSQKEWAAVSEKLTWLFRDCADYLFNEGKFSREEKHVYFRSVTDNEVEHGMLATKDIKDKVACFQRTLIDLDKTDGVAGRYTDLVEEGIDLEAEELRERLRMVKLPTALPPDQLFRYNVQWKNGGVNSVLQGDHQRYIEQFGQDFTKTIERMITEAVNKANFVKGRSPLFEEVLHHLHFCKNKCDTFCGREEMLKDIFTKLNTCYGKKEESKETECKEAIATKEISEDATQDMAEVILDDEDSETDINADFYVREREKRKRVNAEWHELAENLKHLGVTITIGDSMDDMESDPKFNIRDRLTEMPNITEHTKPLIIYGESGSGKTALMAKVAQISKKQFPNSYCMVRFLGTSTMSTTIREVLTSLCLQIWHLYKVPRPSGIDLQADFQFLVKYFTALLWQIDTSERPLVIVLDSVDQLTPADHAHFFNWIPHKLPPTVHLLISMVTNRHDCLKNIRQIFVQTGQYVEVVKMENETASAMITSLCIKANRHLSKKQRNMLMDKFASCSQPLYLKLLTDMAISWKSYTKVNQAALGVTVKEAINHLFGNLEKKHGEVLIKKAFAYLCAAREGLTDAEIEDLLSLDDEVLQDTYIYHLPPDPDVIRLPPLLWKRVQYDIEEYVVERQSGGTKVITWYHRQFMEAANERYLTKEIKSSVHKAMAEYFQGIYSVIFKPLELRKVKKGFFPKAVRNVPPQPLKFSNTLYNSRKLNELPFHLILSQQFLTLLLEILLDPEWLYAKCHMMSLTALMEDIQMAEAECAEQVIRDKQELTRLEGLTGHYTRRKLEESRNKLQADTEVLAGIKQLAKMILLASDSIRKDPVYLPVQILCQFGPNLRDGTVMEQFVERCRQWCDQQVSPLLLPQRDCTMQPGRNLMYTIEVDIVMTGDSIDRSAFQGLYLREDVNQLFVVGKQSAKPDQIYVFDICDYGSCILTEDFNCHICSIQFAGKNRYLVLRTFLKSESGSQWKLYRSSTASPITLPHPPTTIAVSDSGKYVAYSSGNLVEVCSTVDGELKEYYSIREHSAEVDTVLISPNDAYLVAVERSEASKKSSFLMDTECTLFVFDLKLKQLLHKKAVGLEITQKSKITRQNLLICTKMGYKERGTLVIYDLKKGEVVQETKLGQYDLDFILLHSSQRYVLVGYRGTSVVNGDTDKHATVVSIANGQTCGRSPLNGPYSAVTFFGSERLYYALCNWRESQVAIFFAGLTSKPLQKAVAVHIYSGHNMPVVQILVTSAMDVMYTASKDNSIKVWDIKPVLEEFQSELTRLEKMMSRDSDLEDVVAQLKPLEVVTEHKTTRIALNRNADRVYVGTDTSQLRMYDAQSGELKLTSDLDIGPVTQMMLSKNGQFLIVGGKTIHIEDFQSVNSKVLTPRGHLSCMAESNNILVAGSSGMEAKGRVWNIDTGEVLKDFELLYSFSCVAINNLGNMVVSSLFDFPVIVHLTDNEYAGSAVDTNSMDTNMSSAVCCCVSPDDKMAACSSVDGAVRVITMTGTYLYRLQQRSSAVALAFKPDGKSLISAGYRSIYVWNLKDGSLKYKLTRHRDFVNSLMFDETGRYLATASRDKQLVLWDFRRAVSIATFQTHCQVSSMDIGPKAETVVYIPQGIADVAILKPNQSLTSVIRGRYRSALTVTAQTQALALAFSGQTTGKTSRACSVM